MSPPRRIIGRRACSWCGFDAAHVRQNEGRSAYCYCPQCGLSTQAKNGAQTALITQGMRPEPSYAPEPAVVTTKPGDLASAPAPVPKRRTGLWDTLMGQQRDD